jgi:hypothetical protein
MGNKNDLLLEPFPVHKKYYYQLYDLKILYTMFSQSHREVLAAIPYSRRVETNLNHHGSTTKNSSQVKVKDEIQFKIYTSESPSRNNKLDPVSVASVAGDTIEFRKIQEDLRNLNLVTSMGTQQALIEILNRKRENSEAR